VTAAFHALPPSDGVLLRRSFSEGNVGARSWGVPNPFTTPTFRYLLGQESADPVTIEVLDAAGTVLWRKDGPRDAGYHEVAWAVERGGRGQGGRGGGGQGGPGGQGQERGQSAQQGPRPGAFAVRIRRGEQSTTMTFRVHDRRGSGSLLGAWPADEELGGEREDGEHEQHEQPAAAGGRGR
jgi:hypothetical protein